MALSLIVLSLPFGSGTVLAHSTGAHLLDLHAREAAHAIGHGHLPIVSTMIGLLMALGLTLAARIGLRRLVIGGFRWRALALALSLAVSVLALESAVHSVHHLGDSGSAAACAVLVGSQHLSWAEGDAPSADAPPACVSTAPLGRTDDIAPAQIHRPHQGRAPPA